MDFIHLLDIRNAWFVWFGNHLGYQRTIFARGQIRYTWAMGILDNLEAYLDLDQLDNAWDDSDLELQTQNPHIS
jgi:hypothetical protein